MKQKNDTSKNLILMVQLVIIRLVVVMEELKVINSLQNKYNTEERLQRIFREHLIEI